MPETPRTWTLTQDVEHPRFSVAAGPSLAAGEAVEAVEKAPIDAEIERLQRAQEHEIAMRLRVERKHIPAPEHLPTPEEVNRQRKRAERGDAERERLLDLLERAKLTLTRYEYGEVIDARDSPIAREAIAVDCVIGDCLREYGRLGKEES